MSNKNLADKSFISTTFSLLSDIAPTALDTKYTIELADGKVIGADTILRCYTLNLLDHPFNIDLMPIVRIPYGNEVLTIQGDSSDGRSNNRLNIISFTKTQKYIQRGCHVFLTQITKKKAKDKSEEKRLENLPILRNFPEDLPGLPPTQQFEFQIDLVPGAALVARSPYRLASSEMKELSTQLQELSNKGVISPSSSP
ncbi:hypothetical protein Tco_0687247 [Tanacetum coccineum]